MSITIEVKLTVGKDGITNFSGILLSRKDTAGNQIEEITISKEKDIQSTIETLENIISSLKKVIGIKEEEQNLENLINFIVEDKKVFTKVESLDRPIWNCEELYPKCIGCEGCGGLTGDEANFMIQGNKILAIKSYRNRVSAGLRDSKIKVEQWYETLGYKRKRQDGNI